MLIHAQALAAVSALKAALQAHTGASPHDQRLLFAGKQLEDSASLRECGLFDDAGLCLTLRLPGGMLDAHAQQTAQTPPPGSTGAPPGEPTASSTNTSAQQAPPPASTGASPGDAPASSIPSPAAAASATPNLDADFPPLSGGAQSGTTKLSDTAIAKPASPAAPPAGKPAAASTGPRAPPGLIFASGPAHRLANPSSPPLSSAERIGKAPHGPARATEGETRLFLASCGATLKRLKEAVEAMRKNLGVMSVTGPLASTGTYGCVLATATPEAALELAARFNALWSEPGPISLATVGPVLDAPTWWVRPRIGKGHVPADERWRIGSWPIELLAELTARGVTTEGAVLSRRDGGVWLAGTGSVDTVRAAALALGLESAVRATPDCATYRLGPVDDMGLLPPDVAEEALRAILAHARSQLLSASGTERKPLTLSALELRSIAGADFYVWQGEGGPCDEEGRPLLLGRLLESGWKWFDYLIVGIDPAAVPDEPAAAQPTRGQPGQRYISFADCAAAARTDAQPTRRALPAVPPLAPATAKPQGGRTPPAIQAPQPAPGQGAPAWQQQQSRRSRRRRGGGGAPATAAYPASSTDVETGLPAPQRRKDVTVAPPVTSSSSDDDCAVLVGRAPPAALIAPATQARPAAPAATPIPQTRAVAATAQWPTGRPGSPVTHLRTASAKRPRDDGRAAAAGAREAFARRIYACGLLLGTTEGDGNCLFRALSDQLNGDGGRGHATLRQEAVNFLRANRQLYDGTAIPRGEFDRHLAEISRPGTKAGATEVDAIRRLHKRSFVVHQGRPDVPFVEFATEGDDLPPLHLAFTDHGKADDGHYDTVHYAADAAKDDWAAGRFNCSSTEQPQWSPDWHAYLHSPPRPATAPLVDQPPPGASATACSQPGATISTGAHAAQSPAPRASVAGATPEPAPALTLAAVAPGEESADAVMASAAVGACETPASVTAPAASFAAAARRAPVGPAGTRVGAASGGVPRGMCAPTAISDGLRRYCASDPSMQRSPEEVQEAVTGSRDPRPWLPGDFLKATRILRVALVLSRRGSATQTICLGDREQTGAVPRIFLTLATNGSHVELTPLDKVPHDGLFQSREGSQYIDVKDEGVPAGLKVLINVKAASAVPPAADDVPPALPTSGRCLGCSSPGAVTDDGRCVRCEARRSSLIPREAGEFGRPFVRMLTSGALCTRARNGLPYAPAPIADPPPDLVQVMSRDQLLDFTRQANQSPYDFLCPDLRDAIEWERGRVRDLELERESVLRDAVEPDRAIERRLAHGVAGDVEDLPRRRRRHAGAPRQLLPLRRRRDSRDGDHAGGSDVFHGLCAATAINRQLGRSVAHIQQAVKGSPAPAPWTGGDFIRAAVVLDVDLTVTRDGFAPVLIGHEDGRARFQIAIHITANGGHARSARPVRADSTLVAEDDPTLPAILEGVAANSGVQTHADGEADCAMPPAAVAAPPPRPAGRRSRGRAARAPSGRPRDRSRAHAPPPAPAEAADPRTVTTARPDEDTGFGPCLGFVPPGVEDIKTLMAALPCNLPGHVDGWMRKQAWHLRRILDMEPDPGDGFTTDEARWRYEMAVLGPKMEFELLRHRASAKGMKWAQGLGATLPPIRALLPPMTPAAWQEWDGTALLAALREAVDARAASPRAPRPATDDSICGLLELGRIPAAKAALYGEAVLPHPDPSDDMRKQIQEKNPLPESYESRHVVPQADWQAAAEDCERRCSRLPEAKRVSAEDLLRAAQMQRAGASAGPDGWSGLYLRRLATLFPFEVAELLWREFRSLSETFDPLLACTITDATVGGLAKPRGGIRPIVIGRCATRCMVAYLVKRSRTQLRKLLERGQQYGLTGVLPAVVEPLKMLTKCAAAGVPWALTDDDFSNAFNAVSQRALFDAVQRIADVAPELAACMLRGQCMIRGSGYVEMTMRGRYPPGQYHRHVPERYARGGGQGCPDMPAAFAEVIAKVNLDAEAAMRDVSGDMTAEAACAVLWPLIRQQAGLSPAEEAPGEWRAALGRLMAMKRPDPGWGGPRGEVSSAYADDTHSGGWAIACIIKSLRRIAQAREHASLQADPLKCKVLTSEALKPLLDALLQPLRRDHPDGWQVVTHICVSWA